MASKTALKTEGSGVRPRPPIVVVMGHVDHGKTTLLDYIRKASVAAREAGGITQAVGAYEIEHVPAAGGAPRKITFIDTPGHEAFSAMRARGATAADLAILVVAADEGVKPQTREAIKILEDAKTPFVVALNKIDKAAPGAVEKAKADLAAAGVLVEGFGGQVSWQGISAKTGEGVGELLDLVLLTADMEELTYDPSAPATGYVLEARRDPRRGIEASVIVREGTLRRGDAVATASARGKVKILEDFLEKTVNELEPSAPAVVIGFETLPKVGEEFSVGGPPGAATKAVVKEDRASIGKSQKNAFNITLKAGDAGSLEVLSSILKNIDPKGGKTLNIIEESVGEVTDGDVRLAQATGAVIIGFKNRVEKGARTLAEAQDITIITSGIVYDLVDAVEEFLSGKRGPAAAGTLEVLAVFNQEKTEKQLVGGRVIEGVFRAKAGAEILRGAGHPEPVGVGRIMSLREKKAEIVQAEKGKEIGVIVNSAVVLQAGDTLVIRK